jgi:hypothetical protein
MAESIDEDVLRYHPWGDDDSDYRVLDNRMSVTRVPHDCVICFETIPVGSRIRAQREVYDGKAMTFRFCLKCCAAMAAQTSGADLDGRRIERRTTLGMRNAERKRNAHVTEA